MRVSIKVVVALVVVAFLAGVIVRHEAGLPEQPPTTPASTPAGGGPGGN